MFTDVEMAILSQLSYCDYNDITSDDLHAFLTNNKAYLKEQLGEQYTNALESLMKKTAEQSYNIVATKKDPKTGFAAFAVEGPNHEVTIACRGTEFSKLPTLNSGDAIIDLYADFQLTQKKESSQQKKMDAFVEDLEENGYNGYYFTGHSLGGNIALHGAITLNDPSLLKGVKTYNAPGYNQEYLEENKLRYSRISEKVTNYQNKRDAISEALLVPGNVVILDCKDPKATGMDAHSFNQLVVSDSGESFQSSKRQKKETTGWGSVFKYGSQGLDVAHDDNRSVITWGGTTIKVPVSTLQENAAKMQSFADTNADVFDRVYQSLLCLKGSGEWQGTSLEAIVEATEKNKKKFEDTIDELQALATFLDKFVTEISQKDEEIKKQINSVG